MVLPFHFRTKLPAVHQHVESFRMPWAMVCSKWFVCLYRLSTHNKVLINRARLR